MSSILQGDCLAILKTLESESIDCVVTSPPYYGLRDYGVIGQIGLEETPEEFVAKMVEVFEEVRRVLKKEGTLWLNLGDSYATNAPNGFQGKHGQRKDRAYTAESLPAKKGPGIKPKDLMGIPWRVAFALQAAGWYLRQDIIWSKPNPMPESVTDRCTKAHEYIFLLSKSSSYFYDQAAIREKAVWGIEDRLDRVSDDHKSFPNEQRNGIRKREAPSIGGWNTGPGSHAAVDFQREGGARTRRSQPKGSFSGKTGDTAFRKTGETRNKRSVWTVGTHPFKEAHFATFPEKLIEPMVLAGCPMGGVCLDPFFGAGTTGVVAKRLGRNYLGIELNPEYVEMATKRLSGTPVPML